MLCEGCRCALKFTPSMVPQRTTFNTSFERIQLSAKNEGCFLCTIIYKASMNEESPFHLIYKDAVRATEQEREPATVVLIYSSEVGTRPDQSACYVYDTILVVRFRFSFIQSNHHIKDAELRFFFSPMDREQPGDESWMFSEQLRPRRKTRSRACPHCQADNPTDEEYKQLAPEEEDEDDDDARTSLRDGFRFDCSIDERYASDYTGSPQSWAQVIAWLNLCHTRHTNCPKPADQDPVEYPTRLLDLSPLDKPHGPLRLILSKEDAPRGGYMTLSHRWGRQEIVTLNSQNLDSFRENIDFEKLPKTFQDAAIITRKLGIRYLWIDSLCIIQSGTGSAADWHRESAAMDRVYLHSFLNIGATGAIDGTSGCFRERDYMEVFRPVLSKPECKTHYLQYRQKYRLIEETFLDDWLFNEPLLERGWVYQERFLAPRMLHFGSKQLFWECSEMRVCESFPAYLLPPIDFASLSKLKTPSDDEGAITALLGYYRWYRIVSEYTSKDLTMAEDKLVALSGVSRQYQELMLKDDDEYLAGIWRSDLPGGLCWTIEGSAGRRAEEWRAPSWSWASMDGRILPPVWGVEPQGYELTYLTCICEAKTKCVAEINPFGAVESAAISLKGRLVAVQAAKDTDKNEWELSYRGVTIEGSAWFPDESPAESLVTVLCLCFATGSSGMHGLTVAIVEGESDAYVRTGVFRIRAEESDQAIAGWCYPHPPFSDLRDMDVENEDLLWLV